jgi:hypothetical protein
LSWLGPVAEGVVSSLVSFGALFHFAHSTTK